MKTSRLFAFGALLASFGWLLAGGCSSADRGSGLNGGSAGSGGSLGDAQTDGTTVMPDASGNEGGAGNPLSSSCGVGECVPDDPTSCQDYDPPLDEPGGAGGAGGGAGDGGQSFGGNGLGGAPEVTVGGDGGMPAGGAGADGAGAGGAEGGAAGGGVVQAGAYSCQVARQNNQPVRHCERAGRGRVNAPCFSSADCAGGLACVTEGDAGRCLPYCCSRETTCDSGTYCAERQLRSASASTNNAEPAVVPVCVPADDCSLEDPFPCPSDRECRCKEGTACMVVRGDGTTTCLKPETGQQGDPCPCAWNHVCSSATNQCVKICHTDPAKDDCGEQKCQASAELPQNFGVCVGPVK